MNKISDLLQVLIYVYVKRLFNRGLLCFQSQVLPSVGSESTQAHKLSPDKCAN